MRWAAGLAGAATRLRPCSRTRLCLTMARRRAIGRGANKPHLSPTPYRAGVRWLLWSLGLAPAAERTADPRLVDWRGPPSAPRTDEHKSELQSLTHIPVAVITFKKKTTTN